VQQVNMQKHNLQTTCSTCWNLYRTFGSAKRANQQRLWLCTEVPTAFLIFRPEVWLNSPARFDVHGSLPPPEPLVQAELQIRIQEETELNRAKEDHPWKCAVLQSLVQLTQVWRANRANQQTGRAIAGSDFISGSMGSAVTSSPIAVVVQRCHLGHQEKSKQYHVNPGKIERVSLKTINQ